MKEAPSASTSQSPQTVPLELGAAWKARWKEGPKATRLPAAGKDSQGTESPAPSALRPSRPPGRAGGQGEGAEASPSCRKVWLNRPRRPSTTRTDKLVHQFLPLFLENSRSPNFDNCDAQDCTQPSPSCTAQLRPHAHPPLSPDSTRVPRSLHPRRPDSTAADLTQRCCAWKGPSPLVSGRPWAPQRLQRLLTL